MSMHSPFGGAHQDVLGQKPTDPESKVSLVAEIKDRARKAFARKDMPVCDALYSKAIETLADAPLVFVVLLIEPADENFMCGCGAVWGQGHGLVLGQCDRSACLVAHLRMGGCRQSGQMRCGCMHAAC